MSSKEERRALICLLTGGMIIALAPILVRLSELPPVATAFYRMALAIPIMGLMLGFQARSFALSVFTSPLRFNRLIILAAVFFAGDLAIWHWSISATSVANATLMANMAPIFVAIFAFFLWSERFHYQFILGLGAAVVGAYFLVHGGISAGNGSLFGDILGILTALCYAGYILSVSLLRKSMDTMRLMFGNVVLTALILLPIMLATESHWLPQTFNGWMVLFALALLPQCIGQGLIAYGMAHLPASYSSVSLLVQPVGAAALAWLLLHEAMGTVQLIGAIVVLCAIIVCHRTRLKQLEQQSAAV